jgi:hypothetical protein
MPEEFVTTVSVPTKAHLVLRTDEGAEFPVTDDTFTEFGFVNANTAYTRFKEQFCRGLGLDEIPDDGWANTVRYMVECALFYSLDFDYGGCDEDIESAQQMLQELRAIAPQ